MRVVLPHDFLGLPPTSWQPPGAGSAQLSNLCSTKCCDLKIKSASDWLPITVSSPEPQSLQVLTRQSRASVEISVFHKHLLASTLLPAAAEAGGLSTLLENIVLLPSAPQAAAIPGVGFPR